MKNLSPGQLRVLTALGSGPKTTSNVTNGSVVSGTAAVALSKRGLVSRKTRKDETTVAITAAGRKALEASKAKAKARAKAKSKLLRR